MKIKNKILPMLGGVSALAGVVTPLVTLTSCSQDNITMVDLLKGVAPGKQYASENGAVGQHTASSYIMNFEKDDMDAFKNDIYYGLWQNFVFAPVDYYRTSSRRQNTKIEQANFGINTPTFSTMTVRYPGEPEVTYPTISMKMKFEYKMSYDSSSSYSSSSYSSSTTHYTTTVSGTVEYKNVPFYATYEQDMTGSTTSWHVGIYDAAVTDGFSLKYAKDAWSINFNYDFAITTPSVSDFHKEEIVDKYSIDKNISTYGQLEKFISETLRSPQGNIAYILFLDYSSYYLGTLACLPEAWAGTLSTTVSITGTDGLSSSKFVSADIKGLKIDATNVGQYRTYMSISSGGSSFVMKDYSMKLWDEDETHDIVLTDTTGVVQLVIPVAKSGSGTTVTAGTSINSDRSISLTVKGATSLPTTYEDLDTGISAADGAYLRVKSGKTLSWGSDETLKHLTFTLPAKLPMYYDFSERKGRMEKVGDTWSGDTTWYQDVYTNANTFTGALSIAQEADYLAANTTDNNNNIWVSSSLQYDGIELAFDYDSNKYTAAEMKTKFFGNYNYYTDTVLVKSLTVTQNSTTVTVPSTELTQINYWNGTNNNYGSFMELYTHSDIETLSFSTLTTGTQVSVSIGLEYYDVDGQAYTQTVSFTNIDFTIFPNY